MVTISVTLKPEITYGVQVPRAAFVRFPLGNPFGEAGRADLQTRILLDLLSVLAATPGPPTDPGTCGPIARLPYRWRID